MYELFMQDTLKMLETEFYKIKTVLRVCNELKGVGRRLCGLIWNKAGSQGAYTYKKRKYKWTCF